MTRASMLMAAALLWMSSLVSLAGPIPPAGNEIPAADRQRLTAGAAELGRRIEGLRAALAGKPELLALLPDVQIYHKAVDWPLRYGELMDVKKADAALAAGRDRCEQLAQGKAPWLIAGGIRAYVSEVDGSIQPYYIAPPANYAPGRKAPYRLDFFFHGRNEKLMELEFVSMKSPDSPTMPPDEDRIVVFPYGRYCCANKFVGEIDTLEVLAQIKKQYPIDPRRIIATGFSMGGAACWHHAVHYTDLFVAASPGAGFVDTRYYQKMDDSGAWAELPEWRKKLMHLYDCPDWALNLSMLPTISYAGELDKQKAAGDVMEKAMADLGLKLQRVGAPNTPHKYSPEAKQQIAKMLGDYAAKGRDPLPRRVRLVTYTLRYNKMDWVTVERLGEHWKRATVEAQLDRKTDVGVPAQVLVTIKTENVTRLRVDIPPLPERPVAGMSFEIVINGQRLKASRAITAEGAIRCLLRKSELQNSDRMWESSPAEDYACFRDPTEVFVKRHGVQGPVDDAFLSPFLIVRPTGKPLNEKVGQWCKHEMEYAIAEWRRIFRGEPRVKDDRDVTEKDIQQYNLILFGDPQSNALIKRASSEFPIWWLRDYVQVGRERYPADQHALVMVWPNPMNGDRYVVLNSGFTFRRDDHKSNAWQIAKLPDYAVIDLSQAPDDQWPGKIAAAGFFDEQWKLKEGAGR